MSGSPVRAQRGTAPERQRAAEQPPLAPGGECCAQAVHGGMSREGSIHGAVAGARSLEEPPFETRVDVDPRRPSGTRWRQTRWANGLVA